MAVPSSVLQQRLKDLDYDPGPIDNFYGDVTEQAVIAFQRDHGLDPNGHADEETEALLFPEGVPGSTPTGPEAPTVDEADIRNRIAAASQRFTISDLADIYNVSADDMRSTLRRFMILDDLVDGWE